MKTMLISAASAIVMFGIASAGDVIVSPVSHHEIGIAQSSVDREGDVLCTTRELVITKGDGSKTIRRSEDCDE